MALSRRTGSRFQSSIWPGFVDAMTGLLLVLMFVLTIFMVVQFVLTERITGQETELNTLSGEVAALARALGLQEQANTELEDRVGALNTTLQDARDEASQREALIASLTAERDRQVAALEDAESRITGFEAQVAGLLAQRDTALGERDTALGERDTALGERDLARSEVDDLAAREAALVSAQDALNLALASARTEIDAQAEAARLAAARREALDALVADLRARNAGNESQIQDLQQLNASSEARVADLLSLTEKSDAQLAELRAGTAARDAQILELQSRTSGSDAQIAELQARTAESAAQVAALQARNAQSEAQIARLQGQMDETAQALSDEEVARLAEAAAAEALRARLQEADAELTAMTLALEAQRSKAEETLALLAAARAVEGDLDARLSEALIRLQAAEQTGSDAQETLSQTETELARLRSELATRDAILEVAEDDQQALRAQLTAAVAARLAAEQTARDLVTTTEQKDLLLSAARQSLNEEERISAEAQRQTELLNQQVAALRGQLGNLQSLLDDANARDEANAVELQSLGSDLNTALARVAAEQRRRAELEAAERARLEAEALALQEQAKSLEAQTQDLEQYRSEFFGRLRDVLGAQEGVRIEGDRFVFSSEVLFPPGGAVLSQEGQREIAKVARILRSVVGDIPSEIDWVIRVDGHTDDVPLSGTGQFADNWELSQARALSVVKYMINFLGIPPGRLAANGFGQFQPVASGDTDEARAQNRRIELKFTEK